MILFILSVVFGLVLLVWSADKFVDASSSLAKYYGMPPLIIGMVIVGFGTSAPELVVSALASYEGNPGIALGNAYGSNISNIALILGATALMLPIAVNSQVIKKELPILTAATFLSVFLLMDYELSRLDAFVLIILFGALMIWTLRQVKSNPNDSFGTQMSQELTAAPATPVGKLYGLLLMGLILLIASSRLLVYGSVGIASSLGVPDIIIGLTIVAVGTSLPEFASSIIAARKGESDIALGNVIGSNLFNTMAVVGLAGLIAPLKVERDVLMRDLPVMVFFTLLLFVMGYGFRGKGRINRVEGGILMLGYVAYLVVLLRATF